MSNWKACNVEEKVNLLWLFALCWSYEPQNGDVIFQTSGSSQSKEIQLATNSKFSHVGIVYVDANHSDADDDDADDEDEQHEDDWKTNATADDDADGIDSDDDDT